MMCVLQFLIFSQDSEGTAAFAWVLFGLVAKVLFLISILKVV